eukprot:8748840-Karenia_brevis.AAC.1
MVLFQLKLRLCRRPCKSASSSDIEDLSGGTLNYGRGSPGQLAACRKVKKASRRRMHMPVGGRSAAEMMIVMMM